MTYSSSPMSAPQPAPLGLVQTWTMALAPSEQNFQQIAADPSASAGRDYLWLFIASLIGGFISGLINVAFNLVFHPALASTSGILVTVCGGPIFGAIIGLIGITINVAIVRFLASALGGTGSFTRLLHSYAAFFVPLVVVDSILGAIPIVNFILIFIGLYTLVLTVTATKAEENLSWGRALVASLLVPILLIVLLACIIIVALALLGPAIGGVFSSIITTL